MSHMSMRAQLGQRKQSDPMGSSWAKLGQRLAFVVKNKKTRNPVTFIAILTKQTSAKCSVQRPWLRHSGKVDLQQRRRRIRYRRGALRPLTHTISLGSPRNG